MKVFIVSLITSHLLIFSAFVAANEKLEFCTDQNPWFPYIEYKEQGEIYGSFKNTLQTALDAAHIEFSIIAFPWKRCLAYAERGTVAGIMGVSYLEERDKYLDYPAKAKDYWEKQEPAPYRMAHVAYVVVTPKNSNYNYQGDPATIPQPILIPLGYSMIKELKKYDLIIDSYSTRDFEHFRHLTKFKIGSLIVIRTLAEHYLRETPEFNAVLSMSPQPVKQKSYFLAFSKMSDLSIETKQRIWAEIDRARPKGD